MKTLHHLYKVLLFTALCYATSYGQKDLVLSSSLDRSSEVGLPFYQANFNNATLTSGELKVAVSYPFNTNSFGVAWNSTTDTESPSDFHIEYRYKDALGIWSTWNHAHGEVPPSEVPTNKYWSSLIISDYMLPVLALEVKINPPTSATVTNVQVDGSYIALGGANANNNSGSRAANCPEQPFLLQRSDWWSSSLPADELYYPNATNSKTPSYNSNTTHAFIHHGASSNNYTDGASVVRSYWSFHVNSRGWKDLGYTYLVDKFGNLYMGRYNPNWPAQDILGAHTGVANPNSFAICCVGDFASTTLPPVALEKIYKLLAYKLDLRGMNPIGTGFIHSKTIDIISGHRDAPNASTTCPGNGMYGLLSQIRTRVKDKLDSCALPGGGGPNPNQDNIAPVTSINSAHLWQRGDFAMPISDVDDTAGSGINDRMVNVSYYDAGEWTANASNGYFNDQFTQLSPAWTAFGGNWFTQSGELVQNDEGNSNTNMYASLNQAGANRLLYHWKQTISGAGTNKRAGLHIMCSTPNQSERGDSYLIYLREDNDKVQIYKSTSNNLALVADTAFVINASVEYDVKTIFNKTSGKISVYVNNQLTCVYSDPFPLTNGYFISYRSGEAILEVNKLEVYKDRTNGINVTVGQGSKDIPVQNLSPTQAAGCIKAISTDVEGNVSQIQERFVNVDWTKPGVNYVNDGYTAGTDVDTIIRDNKIEGNWSGADVNSGIKKYYFGAGDAPGATNLIPFTDVGLITEYDNSISLTVGTTYYVSIQIFNGAGLDTIVTSNGQYLKSDAGSIGIEQNSLFNSIKMYPNPSNGIINISFNGQLAGDAQLQFIDASGRVVSQSNHNLSIGENRLIVNEQLAKGAYFVKLNLNEHQVLLGVQVVE